VDAESLAQQYISRGKYIRGTVETGRTEFAQTAINVIVKLLAGATVPERYMVPPGDVITKAMLDQQTGNPLTPSP
jgi:hypothetical protein